MEPARKRIKLEEDLPGNGNSLTSTVAPQNLDPVSFSSKAAYTPHCQTCKLFFHSNAERERHNSKWHYTNVCWACDEGFPDNSKLAYNVFGSYIVTAQEYYTSQMSDQGGCPSKAKRNLIAETVKIYCQALPRDCKSNLMNYRCPGCSITFGMLHKLFAHLEHRSCTLRNWIEETKVKELLIALEGPVEREKDRWPQRTSCNKSFSKNHALEQHLVASHLHTYCSTCKIRFERVDQKESHVAHYHPSRSAAMAGGHSPTTNGAISTEQMISLMRGNGQEGKANVPVRVKTEPGAVMAVRMADVPVNTAVVAKTKAPPPAKIPVTAPPVPKQKKQTKQQSQKSHKYRLLDAPQALPDHGSEEALLEHIENEHGRCLPCNKWFYPKKELDEHNDFNHFSHLCESCDIAFQDEEALEQHLEDGECKLGATQDSIHTDVQEFYTALDHRDPDTNVWPLRLNFVCYTCETTFDRMASLLEHLERRECPLRDWQRKSHVKRIFYGPLKRKVLARIECVKCNRLFKDQSMRNKHMQEKHGQFYCFACKRDHNDMATHFREMQGPGNWHPDSEFPCNDYSRITIFKKEWQLYQHRWTVHLGCAFCGVNFENKETLSRHDNKYHRKCGICASIEPSWWDLRSHYSAKHGIKLPLQPAAVFEEPEAVAVEEVAPVQEVSPPASLDPEAPPFTPATTTPKTKEKGES
ncbi:hypothetical protein ACLX1H_002875 [Fusarium chlamydosporum]